MEINNLPVELTVVWNGHFSIDNPAQNKGAEGGPGRWGGGQGGAAPIPCPPSTPPQHPHCSVTAPVGGQLSAVEGAGLAGSS